MKTSTLIIVGLLSFIGWREYTRITFAQAYCDERVAQAIQQASDDLLDACEAKIDEVLSQF